MKVLLFTHKNDIDGMGNAILAKLTFDNVDYILCETFDLQHKVNEFITTGKIYEYDKIFITDLCLDEKTLSYINEQAFKGTVLAHTQGGVPNLILTLEKLDTYNLGYLIYFFEKYK